ncbi:MAG: hypothetical protein IPK26_16475 [Planctomycetes bacterium]|nr:hypothetical protein [Planctomycetota bacterium]
MVTQFLPQLRREILARDGKAGQFAILAGLASKRFASGNVVLGIGSYPCQYVTRDTFGFAMKATFCTVDGEDREIYKRPRTDSKKNNHRGLIAVRRDAHGEFTAHFPVSRAEEQSHDNPLRTVFENGRLVAPTTLAAQGSRGGASARSGARRLTGLSCRRDGRIPGTVTRRPLSYTTTRRP